MTDTQAIPLAYSLDIEQPKPDEVEAIQGIIDATTQQSEIVAGHRANGQLPEGRLALLRLPFDEGRGKPSSGISGHSSRQR